MPVVREHSMIKNNSVKLFLSVEKKYENFHGEALILLDGTKMTNPLKSSF